MAGLKVLAKTSQKISIGADTFRLKVRYTVPGYISLYFQFHGLCPSVKVDQ